MRGRKRGDRLPGLHRGMAPPSLTRRTPQASFRLGLVLCATVTGISDDVLASAILDRLLHHSATVDIQGGQSYRLHLARRRRGDLQAPEGCYWVTNGRNWHRW